MNTFVASDNRMIMRKKSTNRLQSIFIEARKLEYGSTQAYRSTNG